MAWQTRSQKKAKKWKKNVKLVVLLIIGICIVSYAMGNEGIKDKIDDLKDSGDKIPDIDSDNFDISFDTDCQGDIKEIKIKI